MEICAGRLRCRLGEQGFVSEYMRYEFLLSQRPFEATIVSQTLFVLIYILAVVLSLCVAVMAGYHLHLVCSGETTVEAMDFSEYRKKRVSCPLPV